jgi:hypothetical protein
MSRNIPEVFQLSYDAEVKRAYGQKRLLAGTTREKSVSDAKSIFFRKKGKGMATLHQPGSDRIAMNVKYGQVECVLQDWEAFDYVDKFDVKKFNFSEAKELAEVASDALGLRQDQILIDAIAKGYNAGAMKVGASRTPLTVATLRAGCTKINRYGVPMGDRTFIHTAQMLDDLLATTEVTSSDYNSVKTLVNGELNTFLGLKFIMISENREEGGLPQGTTANDRIGFIYHKDAVGFALGQNVETSMDWVAEKGAWLVGGDFSAGAVVIDDQGVVGVEAGIAG